MKPKFLNFSPVACSLPQRFILALSLGLGAAALTTGTAHADANWVGSTSQDWNTAANWSSAPANPTGNLFVNTAAAGVFPILGANSAFTPVDLILANGGTSTARFDHRAGTLALANTSNVGNWFFVGRGANAATATYNLANTATADAGVSGFAQGSGSLTVGKLWIGGARFFLGGTGTVNVNTSGTITANSTQDFTDSRASITLGYGAGSSGTLNLQNGTVQANSELWVGFSGNGTVNQSGGTLNSTEYFVIGRNNGGNGVFNLSGGTVNAATTLAGSFPVIGSFTGSQGTLHVSGGTFNTGGTIAAPLYVGEGGSGQLTVSGGTVNVTGTTFGLRLGVNASGTGTVDLNGGTLQTALVTKGAGAGHFNFNGGVLKATAASANFMTGLTSATLLANGAKIDSNGFDITIAQDLSGSGGLTKSGAGTLTLAGTNFYADTTAVSAGTLAFRSMASTLGPVTVAAGAGLRVQAFDTTTTVLTADSVTLAGGSSLTFDFNSLNVGANRPLLYSNTALTATGAVAVNILNAANLSSGPHVLIDYGSFGGGGSFTGSPFALGTRSTGTLVSSANALTLNVNADSPKWTGLDNGNWVTGSTGPNKNWRLIGAGTATDYIQGDSVRFDDSVTTGTTNVVIPAADVAPAATAFTNATKNYTLGSPGGFGIAGSGPLTKSGAGALVITNPNTYTGLTTIESGATLTLGNGTSGNDGTLAGTVGVVNSGTLAFNRFGTSTAAYPISGSGMVVKNGPGTQVLTAPNSHTGGTTVNAGTLQTTTTTGAANTGTFNLNGGTFQVNLGAGTDFNYAPTLNLTAASTFGNAAAGSNTTLEGQINFTGTVNGGGNVLNIANPGLARLYMNGALANLGQIKVLSGAMGFDLNTVNDRGTAPVDVAAGAALWVAGTATTPLVNDLTFHGGDGIGNKGALHYEGGSPTPAPLTGNVVLAEGTTGVGAAFAGDTLTLSGNVSGSGALKLVSGGLTLTGANTFTGGSTIALGRLQAASNTALGTGAVTTAAVAGVQLQLGAGVNVSNPLTLSGSSFTGQGVLQVPTGDATYSGPVNVTAATTAGGHFATGGGTLTLAGPVTSSVPLTVRNGIVLLANASSTYPGLLVQQGTVKLGANNVIPPANTVDLGISGAATLDLNGFNQSLAGLTKNTNAATVTNTGGSDATLTTTGTFAFNGVIQNGPTRKTAVTVGSGVLTLGGANTFTGNVTVNGGLVLADNAQLRFTPGPNTLVNSIGGPGTVTFDGDFVIDLAGATVANGNSWTLVNVGTLTETFSPTFSVVDFTETGDVWTKVDGANTWTFNEATGVLSLSVGTASAYATWASNNGLTAANNGATLDPESDGVANVLEFVLGGNPLASDPGKLPALATTATDFIFTFTRADESEGEIALTFQYGSLLTGWTDVAIGATSAGQVTITENGGAPDTVTVTIPKTTATGGKLFGRLRAVK